MKLNPEQSQFIQTFNMLPIDEKIKLYRELHDVMEPSYRKRLLYMIGCEAVYHQRKK